MTEIIFEKDGASCFCFSFKEKHPEKNTQILGLKNSFFSAKKTVFACSVYKNAEDLNMAFDNSILGEKMAANVTMETIYKELKSLEKDVQIVKYALIPEEKVSAKELKEIREIKKEMLSGKEHSFKEVFEG